MVQQSLSKKQYYVTESTLQMTSEQRDLENEMLIKTRAMINLKKSTSLDNIAHHFSVKKLLKTSKQYKNEALLKQYFADKDNNTFELKNYKKNNSFLKYAIYIILFFLFSGLSVSFLLQNNFNETIDAVKKATAWPIVVAFLLVICAYSCLGLSLTLLSKMYKKDYKFHQGFCNGLIGQFFSNITPSHSGGQFAQAYVHSKQGVKLSNSASILLMQFIISQSVSVIFNIICFSAGYSYITKAMKSFDFFGFKVSPIWLCILAFIVNVIVIGAQFGIAYCKPLHRLITNQGIDLLAKLRIVKRPEERRKKLIIQIASFRIELKKLFKNYVLLICVFILTFSQFLLCYSVNYFIGLSVSNGITSHPTYGQSICLTGFLNLFTQLIITPGNSGASEIGFNQMFLGFFDGNQTITNAANIISRSILFYFVTIVGALVTVSYHSRGSKRYQFILDSKTKVLRDLSFAAFMDDPKYSSLVKEEFSKPLFDKEEDIYKKVIEEPLPQDEVLRIFNNFKNEKENNISETTEIRLSGLDNETYNSSKKTLKNVYQDYLNLSDDAAASKELNEEVDKDLVFSKKYREKEEIKKRKRIEKKRKKNKRYIKQLNKLSQNPTEFVIDKDDNIKIVELYSEENTNINNNNSMNINNQENKKDDEVIKEDNINKDNSGD